MDNHNFDIIIIGGGATGFFAAINIVENNPKLKVAILERGKEVLTKVRISGGGRCNVTHAIFEPSDLIKNYPRGSKELLSQFHKFCSKDTVEWFKNHNVELKTEFDGRIFPISNSSDTIINCFLNAAKKLYISVLTNQSVQEIKQVLHNNIEYWQIETQDKVYCSKKIILTTGSNLKIWKILQSMGHNIINPVASLFTFNINDSRLKDLGGIATNVTIKIENSNLTSKGPLLITHWGVSGPAILKLSAWGAIEFFDKNYHFKIFINWINTIDSENCFIKLKTIKSENPKKYVVKNIAFELPNRLWEKLVIASEINPESKWGDVSKQKLKNLSNNLTKSIFNVEGKSSNKDEFVTAGGIDLKEINFKTMESKLFKNLYFGGEIINIDAITGGFNFQNAWTSGYIVAQSIDI